MNIRNKILIAIWLVIIATSLTFAIVGYNTQKRAFLDGVDKKLYASAFLLKHILPEDYHDKLSKDSFTQEEYDRIIVDKNNNLCIELGLQYLWSCMIVDDQVVFTTSTSPGLDVIKQDHAKFFDVHGDPHAFDQVFSTMKPSYSSFRNEWGYGRMVLIPYLDAKGRPYCFGSSISVNEVMAILHRTSMDYLVLGFIMLLIGLIASLLISNALSRPIEKLLKGINIISSGNLDYTLGTRARDELGQLSRAFDQMTKKLKQSREDTAAFYSKLEEKVTEKTKDLQTIKNLLEERVDELSHSQTAMLYMIEDLNRQAEELKEAQDTIVRSEKLVAIGQLASSVAHELRNPLGVMKNAVYYFNMLELGKKDAEIKENLDILSKEIENSDKVISDLLEFTRIKKPTLQPENINVIAKEVLNRLKISPDIKVVTELEDSLPDIAVDALQIQQVFYNIAINAIAAIDKSGRFKIKTNLKGDFVEISFADTGCGIPKENLTKIFDPLFSTKAKGTGLGLSVCRSLVEGHGGKIEVESEVDKGTTFTVRLPIKRG